jgi:hypothetical protein
VKKWFKNGKLHRDNDLPAYIDDDRHTQKWYKEGKLHRDNDLPAVIIDSNYYYDHYLTQKWYKEGKLHRDNDLPAVIIEEHIENNSTIKKEWWINGKNQNDYNQIGVYQIIDNLQKTLPEDILHKIIKENKLSRTYIYSPKIREYIDTRNDKHKVEEWFYNNKLVKMEEHISRNQEPEYEYDEYAQYENNRFSDSD